MPLLRAYDRGIVVASLYAAALIACAELLLLRGSAFEMHAAAWAVCGFLAGAIGGFSNTDAAESFRRDLARNASDAGMIVIWTANLLLGLNLVVMFGSFDRLLPLLGVFACSTLFGGVAGEPALLFLGSLTIKGRRPFLTANDLAASMRNPHARFVARVILHTLVVAGLLLLVAALAFIALIIVAAIAAIAILGFVLKAMSNEASTSSSGHRGSLRIGRGQKIDDDGRIVEEGLFFDTPTGQRINREGQVVEEGHFFDRPTGMKIARDGRVQKEGFFFDHDTGVRLEDDGEGGRRVIKEGFLFDHDTGRRISASGRPVKEGLFFDHDEGLEIDEDGNVKES